MTLYRKKPVVVEATQWFKNGDHPQDNLEQQDYEGKIVRRYCRPYTPNVTSCRYCGAAMQAHGWIDTKEGGHIVCPGDWIITGVQGERYPCKPDIFAATYDAVSDKEKPL